MPVKSVRDVVFESIDAFNDSNYGRTQLEKRDDQVLFGLGGALDSLGLVNLIVALEGKLEDELGRTVVLANEKAMSERNSPFRTVGTLVAFVTSLLAEAP